MRESSCDACIRNFKCYVVLVKTGIIEKEYAEILNLEYESREIGDYEIDIEITRDLADERVNLGSKFVLRMEKFINENA